MTGRFLSSLPKLLPFRYAFLVIFVPFTLFYCFIAWLVSGGDVWWVIDFVNGTNVFYGDDAYRFFLAQFAWRDPALYTYNFVLPAALVLDGVVVTLADGGIFWARCIRAILAAAALCLIWDSGLQLKVPPAIMAAAIIIAGLFPRYAFTSLSFYGESWLGLLFCFVVWLFLKRYFLAMAIVAGLLPLVRPEGIYFLVALWFYLLAIRRWDLTVIILLPGVAYGSFLLFSLEYLHDYIYWRQELRKILTKLVLNRSPWEILDTYSLLFVLPALGGFLSRPVRRLWPLVAPCIVWIIVLQIMVLLGHSSYEERYMHVVFPILVLLWAGFFSWCWRGAVSIGLSTRLCAVIIFSLSLLLAGLHLRKMTLIENKIQQEGIGWVAAKLIKGDWGGVFTWHDPSAQSARDRMALDIGRLLAQDAGIDRLVVFDPFLYYRLDADTIPNGVLVGYPAATYMTFHLLLGGQIFVQHQQGKMYTYLRFGEPDYSQDERRALYVDLMPLEGYPYTTKYEDLQYELYLFSYVPSLVPAINLENVPQLAPERLMRANEELMSRRKMN